ncbi:MAG: DUF4892 domain-containing protein [Planctomycetota bacterium]
MRSVSAAAGAYVRALAGWLIWLGVFAQSAVALELRTLPGAIELDNATSVGSFDFITSAVERRDRTLFVERSVRVEGERRRVLIELPSRLSIDEAIEHYLTQLEGTTLYGCSKRACGRSNIWANTVFEEPRLYGSDREQRYVALAQPGRLLSLYAAGRGTRRAYLHIEVIELAQELDLDPNAALVSQLAELGFGVVHGVTPAADGGLTETDLQRLSALGERLSNVRAVDVYVVCHLYSDRLRDARLKASDDCAQAAAAALAAGYAAVADPELPQENRERSARARFLSFAAGALAPRDGNLSSRLELVVPARLWRD